MNSIRRHIQRALHSVVRTITEYVPINKGHTEANLHKGQRAEQAFSRVTGESLPLAPAATSVFRYPF